MIIKELLAKEQQASANLSVLSSLSDDQIDFMERQLHLAREEAYHKGVERTRDWGGVFYIFIDILHIDGIGAIVYTWVARPEIHVHQIVHPMLPAIFAYLVKLGIDNSLKQKVC